MKIKNLAIIILMTTFFIILGTKVYATTGVIKDETVKLRKQPDSKTVLDLLDKGDEVEILEELDGWYKVKATTELGKVTGYISEETVNVEKSTQQEEIVEEPQKPEKIETTEVNEVIPTDNQDPTITVTTEISEGKQYVLAQEIPAKALPLINSREKVKISGNITVIEILNDWARVENDAEYGWIRKNALKGALTPIETSVQDKLPEEEETAPEIENVETVPEKETEVTPEPEEIQTNKVGYVSTEGLRVRKGPSTDSEELHSLSKNDKVDIIGQSGKWYKINLDGEIGYVSSKYISDTKLPETTSRGGSTLTNDTLPKVEEVPVQEEIIPEEPATSGTTGSAVVEYAKQYLGYKYVSGGASPSTGFDCSGFTQYVYKHFGITLNRTSSSQINNGVAVEKSDLQLGDIVLFNNDANTKIGHVGIYVGNGNFIHASNPSDGVKITTLTTGYYQKRYVGARRVI